MEQEHTSRTSEHQPPHPHSAAIPHYPGYAFPGGHAPAHEYHYPPPGFPMGGPPGNGFGGPGLSSGEPPSFLDPVSLLLGLRRCWLQTLLIGLVCAAAAAGITWKVWPSDAYTVQASIAVNPFKGSILNPNPPPKTQLEVNSYKQTQQALLTSWTVFYNALNKPEIRDLPVIQEIVTKGEDPMLWMTKTFSASYSAPEVLTLTALGDDYESLQKIANAIVNAYLDGIVHKDDYGYQSRINQLQKIYAIYDLKAQERKQALQNIANALGAHDTHTTEVMMKYAHEKLNRTQLRLMEQQFELAKLQQQLANEKARKQALARRPISDAEIENWINQDAQMEQYRQQIDQIQAELDQLEPILAGHKSNKIYRDGLARLEQVKKDMARRRRHLRPLGEEELQQQMVNEAQAKIDDLESQIKNAVESERILKEMEKEGIEKTRTVNQDTWDLQTVQGELAEVNDFLRRLASEMETLRVEMMGDPAIKSLGDAYAVPPGIGRKQVMATTVAGLGAFALVLVGFSWREFRARKINTLDEIVHGLGLRVVGTLPALPDRKTRAEPYGVSEGDYWPSHLIESVDTTRTMLLHAARVESIRSVMIASAQSGEGKTSLAIQLAASLARAGRKTLFIDGDLRNPAAHQVFNLELQPGLCELLRGEVQIPAAIQPTSVRGLWVIPAGQWNAQATEALAQDAARPILNRLKSEFDFIILDSSPALVVVDGLLLGQQADATIFSIMHGLSHSPSVYSAHQRFEALGIRILGAVVNGVAPTGREYQLAYARADLAQEHEQGEGEEDHAGEYAGQAEEDMEIE